MARLIENEVINGEKAYNLLDMMTDLREGIWSELNRGSSIDTYRRNLQRAYIDRMEYLMTEEQEEVPARYRDWITMSEIDVPQSDIRPVVRGELRNLQRDLRNSIGRSRDTMTRYHLQDVLERVNLILDPNS